jgi:hypothetical protein
MKGPVATDVVDRIADTMGPYCGKCFGALFIDKIERGPKIGVRITYRHVERHPPCAA